MKIFIGVACLDAVKAQTANTLNSLIRNYDVEVVYQQRCYIHLSRERLADKAIKRGFPYIFFIDWDMCFAPEVLGRLIKRDKDIIGGLYYHRHFPLEPIVGVLKDGRPIELPSNEIPTEPFKCYGTGAGCLLIKTSVFKKLKRPYFFYEPQDENSDGIGEDTWFCKRASEAGFDIWCDPTVGVAHIGEYIFQKI